MKKNIGRIKETEFLQKRINELQKGNGSVILISGEVGVGKTTFVKELIEQPGITIYSSTAFQEHKQAYSIISNILRDCIRKNNSNQIDCGPLAKYISAVLPELGQPPDDISADTLREALISGLLHLVKNSPSIILIDDIHWADTSTLDLIPVLAQRIERVPLLIICVYRSDEISRGHRIINLRDNLRRQKKLKEIVLNPFSIDETREMIESLTGRISDEKFVQSVYRQTGGLPLFIEEIIQMMIEKGFITDSNFHYDFKIESVIPQSLKDTVLQRLSSLSQEAIDMLEAASVVGTGFEINFLLKLVADDKGLDELFQKKLLVQSGNSKASFKNYLIREIVRNEINWLKLKGLHKDIAKVSEKVNFEPGIIAEHWLLAGENNKAKFWMTKSIESLIKIYDYEAAAEESLKALNIKDSDVDNKETHINLLKYHAYCNQMTGNYFESIKSLEKIIELSDKENDHKLLGETHRSLAAVYELQNSNSLSVNHRILAAENFERAEQYSESAQEYYITARKKTSMLQLEKAIVYSQTAMKLSERTGNIGLKANSLGLYGNLLAMKGEVERGKKLVEDALSLALDNDETDAASEIYRRLANTMEFASDYLGARNTYLNAYNFCVNAGKDVSAQICLSCMSYIFFQTGEWKQSLEICNDVLISKFTPETSIPVGHGMMGIIKAFKGETRSAIKSLKAGLNFSIRLNTSAIELYIYWGLAVVHENDLKHDEAFENYNTFLNRWNETQEMQDIVPPLMWASNYFSENGNNKELKRCLEILGKIAAETANIEAAAAFAFSLGESEMFHKKYDEAIHHYKQALFQHERLSIPLEKMLIEYRLGLAFLHNNDTETALKYLSSATRCAKNLGAKPFVLKIKLAAEKAGTFITESRDSESSERVGKGGLTSRQLRVLELICKGLINKEIAEKLFISSRTVDMHVSNILQRLNCKTRTEAINKSKELGII